MDRLQHYYVKNLCYILFQKYAVNEQKDIFIKNSYTI